MNLIQAIMQARTNPMAIISKRFNIPPELQSTKNGQEIAQYLLDTNQITQGELNSKMKQSREAQFKPFFNQK
jgi:hypothetical protein